MNTLQIMQLAFQWGPTIKSIIDISSSNEDLISKLKELAAPVAGLLETEGARLFPKAASALHIAAGAIAAFDPNVTKWLQGTLNNYLSLEPPLVVDGVYGEHTRDAVTKLQEKLGLTVDGFFGQKTRLAFEAVLAK